MHPTLFSSAHAQQPMPASRSQHAPLRSACARAALPAHRAPWRTAQSGPAFSGTACSHATVRPSICLSQAGLCRLRGCAVNAHVLRLRPAAFKCSPLHLPVLPVADMHVGVDCSARPRHAGRPHMCVPQLQLVEGNVCSPRGHQIP